MSEGLAILSVTAITFALCRVAATIFKHRHEWWQREVTRYNLDILVRLWRGESLKQIFTPDIRDRLRRSRETWMDR